LIPWLLLQIEANYLIMAVPALANATAGREPAAALEVVTHNNNNFWVPGDCSGRTNFGYPGC
jgi:hypothetical protein